MSPKPKSAEAEHDFSTKQKFGGDPRPTLPDDASPALREDLNPTFEDQGRYDASHALSETSNSKFRENYDLGIGEDPKSNLQENSKANSGVREKSKSKH